MGIAHTILSEFLRDLQIVFEHILLFGSSESEPPETTVVAERCISAIVEERYYSESPVAAAFSHWNFFSDFRFRLAPQREIERTLTSA